MVSGSELEARRTQRLRSIEILKSGRTPLQVVTVAEEAEKISDQAVCAAQANEPPPAASDCREGCAWCCHLTVGTAAPEVLRIAAYLRKTLAPDELTATLARVRETAERKQSLRPDQRSRARMPCPLLAENRCLAYPVRPLTCRGFNSTDAVQCELSLAPGSRIVVPSYAPQQRICTLVLDGMRAALEQSHLESELLELTAALSIALTVPDATERWLGGASVFATARLT
jgi:Fe-S-cluster containining protein